MSRVIQATSIITLSAAVMLGACRDREPDAVVTTEQADTGGTVVIALSADIDFANGLLSGEIYSQEINRLLFLPLVQYDEQLKIAPLLARSWQMEGDTAVVLNLRNDVEWHDGVKTTAHDVEFTYRYGKDPKTGYPNGDYWEGWNAAEVLDSFRIRFSISPQPEPLANLAWIPVMPRHLLGRVKPENLRNAPFNQKPVGNGPLRFVEYRPNERWIFGPNADFPEELGGRPNISRIVFRVIPEETAQEAELLTGNIDVALRVRAERVAAIEAAEDVRVIARPGRQFGFIGWNARVTPLGDPRVRRALTMAIDRQKLIRVLSGGRGEVAVGPVPSWHWSYDPDIQPLPYSVDSARAQLRAAGIRDTNGDGTLDLPNGSPFQIELKLPANSPFNRDMAEMIRADLAILGVRLVTRPTEFNTLVEDVMSSERKFQAVLFAWVNDFRLVIYDNFHSSAINNPLQFASYQNPAVDSLLDIVQRSTTREAAQPAWRRLQEIMRDEQPWTFLYAYPTLHGVRERVKNVEMDIRGVLINLPEWWVVKEPAAAAAASGN